MADRYWVGGTGNWSDTARWSTSSGGASGASVPTSADKVIFNDSSAAGTFTVTIDTASAVCGEFTASGITLTARKMTLTGTASVGLLSVNGNWTNPGSTLFAWTTWTSAAVTFAASSTVVTNAVSFAAAVVVDGSGITITLGGAFTTTLGITLTNGSFDTSASNYAVTATGITISANSNTRTLTLNASTVTVSGSTPYTDSSTGGYTLNAGTSTISCSGGNPTFAGGGKTFYNVTLSAGAAGTTTITGANTFSGTLTQTSRSATGTRVINLSADQTIGTLTLGAANTAIRRILCNSNTVGVQRTLTVTTFTATTDIDFRDIVAAGSSVSGSNWNSAGTGRFGDGGGNNNKITFDGAKTVYWNLAAGGNWSATAWATAPGSGSAVNVNNFPLAQDTVIFQSDTATLGSGNTVTLENSWYFGSVDMSARTSNTMTLATGVLSGAGILGDFNVGSGVTITSTSGSFQFIKQTSFQVFTYSPGTALVKNISHNGLGGTLRINGNISLNSANTYTLTAGTLDLTNDTTGNYTLSVGGFTITGSLTKVITFGTGNITVAGAFTASGSGFTSTGTGTISMTSASSKTFAGGGFSYAAALNQGGAGALTISGSNTFNDITSTYTATGACTITFTAGTTQTVTQFTASGTSSNLLTLNSTSAGSAFTLSDSSGTNDISYCSLSDSTATGGATWNSLLTNGNVDGGGNTGWNFVTPPVYAASLSDVKLRSMAQRGRF